MIRNLKRNLIIGLALAVGLYFIMGFYADFGRLLELLHDFDWYLIFPALGFVLINYLVRFVKWEFLLRTINVRIPLKPSFTIFISGFTMTLSPAKLGEVLKSFMLKEYANIPISRTSPVIVAERVSDTMGIVILGAAGTVVYGFGREVLAVAIALLAVFIGIVQSRGLCLRMLKLAERLPLVRRFVVHLEQFYEAAYVLLKARILVTAVLLSVVSWFFEGLAAWLCLKGLGLDTSLLLVTFIFAFSSLAGAMAMVPGGLGVTEGSMAGLLVVNGVGSDAAIAGTLIIRLTTFWFAILLGVVAVYSFGLFSTHRFKSVMPHQFENKD